MKIKIHTFLEEEKRYTPWDARGSRMGNNFNRREKQSSRIGPKQRTTETTETDRENSLESWM